ncbi:MAG: type II toxin-antitoxin system VapC family toxin [Caulobacteraceae bacterium]
MILADTSVWVEHLRGRDEALVELLESEEILIHPFVIGELALANLGDARAREGILDALEGLPSAHIASSEEVLDFIERRALAGRGVGWVDASLLASVILTPEARLWTRDVRLGRIAAALRLGV